MKDYIKELDLHIRERDVSTRRIERYKTEVEELRKELASVRNKCHNAEKIRDENYQKYRELQDSIRELEVEKKTARDNSYLNQLLNPSICSSMMSGQIPPPPLADNTYDEILNMTENQSISYLGNYDNNSFPFDAPPPPPLLPYQAGDGFLEQPAAKMLAESIGQAASKPTVTSNNGRKIYGRSTNTSRT